MKPLSKTPLALAAFLLAWPCSASRGADGAPADERVYASRIRPLLAERCFACHGALQQEAGLRLDTAAAMAVGGDSGAAVVPGKPAESLLLRRISDPEPATRMPPEHEGEPLGPDEAALLAAWIAAGCPAPADERPEADPRDHWAFRPRLRPEAPRGEGGDALHPIDAFLGAAHARAGVTAQGEAPRHVLVRRLYVDLIGLPPQPEELAAIDDDRNADWYERLVDRLLDDPRHGERWARHWMDVWRYADWWGLEEQHRNSQKHMWHFRDWIVESLNADLGYDDMVRLMLAADELHPNDLDKLRATGYLARNFYLFSRLVWLDETVEHVSKGLLGLTVNCAKCHAHKYDPVTQEDYYRMRAFFEPIETRLDMAAGEADLEQDGVPRVFDGRLDAPTYLLRRGNETMPDTSRPLAPGMPAALSFDALAIAPVTLPPEAYEPQRRPWVLTTHVERARRAVADAERLATEGPPARGAQATAVAKAELAAVEARAAAHRAAWARDDAPPEARAAAAEAAAAAAKVAAQAEQNLAVARAWAGVAEVSEKLQQALVDAPDAAALAAIDQELTARREAVDAAIRAAAEPGDSFAPLAGAQWVITRFVHPDRDDPPLEFPRTSTGRRTALARWIADPRNPLTARVAANHIWLRHMGRPLVDSAFDFGRRTPAPVHADLLDWLASELVDGPRGGQGWSMKHLHRLICTSAAYRRTSSLAGAEASQQIDPDNRLLWRRDPLRIEAQAVRDGILALSGSLDPARGGPPVPNEAQAESRRRSLYFRHSESGRDPFLSAFDDAAVNQCYQRDQSIVPQQALALTNSALVQREAAALARRLAAAVGKHDDDAFVAQAFRTVLGRPPDDYERAACRRTLAALRALPAGAAPGVEGAEGAEGAEGDLDPCQVQVVVALLNHNDFVTLR